MIGDQSNLKSEDSLFVYTGSSNQLLHTLEENDVSTILDCEHDANNVEYLELDLDLETNAKDKQPLINEELNDNADDAKDKDYSYLILKLDHFKKGKYVSHAEKNLALVNQTLRDVIK